MAISGDSTDGTFSSEFELSRSDFAPLLVTGTNTLYINATYQGGPAGLLFNATLTTTSSAVPEPSGLVMLGSGALGLIVCCRRRGSAPT
jgi:hypothetical protein